MQKVKLNKIHRYLTLDKTSPKGAVEARCSVVSMKTMQTRVRPSVIFSDYPFVRPKCVVNLWVEFAGSDHA